MTHEYFKSNSSLLSLNTYITDFQKADRNRTPASIRTAIQQHQFKCTAHQNSGADHIRSAQGRLWKISFSAKVYPLVFLYKAKRALFKPFQLRALSLSPDARRRQVQDLPMMWLFKQQEKRGEQQNYRLL